MKESEFSDVGAAKPAPPSDAALEGSRKVGARWKVLTPWRREVLVKLRGYHAYLDQETALSPRSITTYKSIIKAMLTVTKGSESSGDVNRYLKNHQRKYIKTAIGYYLKFRGLKFDLVKIRQPKPKPRTVPTLEEFAKVLGSLEGEELLIALFLFNTGARAHEAFKLKRKDLRKDGYVVMETKGRGHRAVRLPDGLRKAIFDHANNKGLLDGEYVFWTEKKACFDSKVTTFFIALNKRSRELVGKLIGTHDFRRNYIIYLRFVKKEPLEVVQRIVGHSNIETTATYTQHGVTKDMLDRAAMSLDELHNKLVAGLPGRLDVP